MSLFVVFNPGGERIQIGDRKPVFYCKIWYTEYLTLHLQASKKTKIALSRLTELKTDYLNYIEVMWVSPSSDLNFSSANILKASLQAVLSFRPAESAKYLFQNAHSENPLCFYK